jgi:hypothetical protein
MAGYVTRSITGPGLQQRAILPAKPIMRLYVSVVTHMRALRSVADRLLRILIAMLNSDSLFD